MSTCCKCQTSVTDTKPVWREGRVVKLCSICVQKTKPSVKNRVVKENHLEAWKKKQELIAEIRRLS